MKRRSKEPVQPKRTAEHQTARRQRQALKHGIADAATQLRLMRNELDEINSFVFVCIAALRTKEGDDIGPGVATVLSAAYEKLVLDVNEHIRDALKALGQDDRKECRKDFSISVR